MQVCFIYIHFKPYDKQYDRRGTSVIECHKNWNSTNHFKLLQVIKDSVVISFTVTHRLQMCIYGNTKCK